MFGARQARAAGGRRAAGGEPAQIRESKGKRTNLRARARAGNSGLGRGIVQNCISFLMGHGGGLGAWGPPTPSAKCRTLHFVLSNLCSDSSVSILVLPLGMGLWLSFLLHSTFLVRNKAMKCTFVACERALIWSSACGTC